MSTIQQEILDKFRQLDAPAQRELLTLLGQQVEVEPLSLGQWLEEATALRMKLVEKYGKQHFTDVQDILDEIREVRP